MKKQNSMPAADAAPQKEFSLIDEALLKSRIYTIRGVKVTLDQVKKTLNVLLRIFDSN